MINEIINGISRAIDTEFNTGETTYEIYSESLEQGLNEPCFSIVVLNPFTDRRLAHRHYREYPVDIHYFPKDEINAKKEMYDVAERLFLVVEVIDNSIRGSNIHYEIVDGVLHFFITYKLYVREQLEPITDMKELITQTGVTNND